MVAPTPDRRYCSRTIDALTSGGRHCSRTIGGFTSGGRHCSRTIGGFTSGGRYCSRPIGGFMPRGSYCSQTIGGFMPGGRHCSRTIGGGNMFSPALKCRAKHNCQAKHTDSYPTIYLAAFSPVALRIKTTNIHDMLKAMMDAQGICNPRGTSSVRISVTAGPVKRKWII